MSQLADVGNAVISFAEGDIAGGLINLLCALPILGKVGDGLKAAKYADEAVDVAKGGLQYSDDLLKAAQEAYPKLAGKIHKHHPIPQYLGGAMNQVLIPLDAAYHQQITNAFRKIHPYNLPKPTEARLQEIMTEVYSQFPLPK